MIIQAQRLLVVPQFHSREMKYSKRQNGRISALFKHSTFFLLRKNTAGRFSYLGLRDLGKKSQELVRGDRAFHSSLLGILGPSIFASVFCRSKEWLPRMDWIVLR